MNIIWNFVLYNIVFVDRMWNYFEGMAFKKDWNNASFLFDILLLIELTLLILDLHFLVFLIKKKSIEENSIIFSTVYTFIWYF